MAGLISDSHVLQFTEMFDDPHELLKAAEAHGLEGIVSKRKDLQYRSGRCPHWLKVKTASWKRANAGRYEKMKRPTDDPERTSLPQPWTTPAIANRG